MTRYSIDSIACWLGITAVMIWMIDVFTLDLLNKITKVIIYSPSDILIIRLIMGVSVFIISFVAYLVWRDDVVDREEFAEFIDRTYPKSREVGR